MSSSKNNRRKVERRHRFIYIIIFEVYIVLLIYFLFFSEVFGRTVGFEEYRYNLKPFAEIVRYFTNMREKNYLMFFINIVGNIVLFMPFGFLFPFISEKEYFRPGKNFFVTFFVTILFVLLMETAQLVTKVGVFDVDDIMMNTFGSVMGYVLYRILRRGRFQTKTGEIRKVREARQDGQGRRHG